MKSCFSALTAAFAATALATTVSARPPNVLFVTVDDLRPQLGAYGDDQAITPHLDALAARSLVLERAYCQIALCNPSRMSFLTGRRPETLNIYAIGPRLRDRVPDVVTLPEWFRRHGYHTASLGKVFHQVGASFVDSHDDPASWSVPHWNPARPTYGPEQQRIVAEKFEALRAQGRDLSRWDWQIWPKAAAYDDPEVDDEALPDGAIAAEAIRRLEGMGERPFFLALGFVKPHLPFVAPRRYWDLYDPEKLRLPDNRFPPHGAPEIALTRADLRTYDGIAPDGRPKDEAQARRLLHGYLACISYVDTQIGRVLEALELLGLRERTIVVVLGDHGFQVGEHDFWGNKHTNFEISTRTPVLIADPRRARERGGRGVRSAALTELIDLLPTLVELAGLPPVPSGVEGTSLVPLFDAPERSVKEAAFSVMPRGGVLGRTVRTDRWRYTEWRDRRGETVGMELYDHASPEGENRNVVDDPRWGEVVARHRRLLEPWPGEW